VKTKGDDIQIRVIKAENPQYITDVLVCNIRTLTDILKCSSVTYTYILIRVWIGQIRSNFCYVKKSTVLNRQRSNRFTADKCFIL